jgi:hypothetical protein
MQYGVNTIQAVAKAIHKDVVPAPSTTSSTTGASVQRYVPTSNPQEAIPAVPSVG